MNRNNFLPHVALALVLILIAAFAGQVRNWKRHWHRHKGTVAFGSYTSSDQQQVAGPQKSKPAEVFVRFRAGISREQIQRITARLHDRVEDEIEAAAGLDLIEDEDGKDANALVAEYQGLPEVEYAERIFQ